MSQQQENDAESNSSRLDPGANDIVAVARLPLPPLSNYVNALWYYKGYKQAHKQERLLPDGSMSLVINLAQKTTRVYDRDQPDRFQEFRGPTLTGVQSQYFIIDTDCQNHIIGVHFKPGGGSAILGVPAHEFQDSHLCLEQVWGAKAHDMHELILQLPTGEEKLAALERLLLSRLRKPAPRHPAIAFALEQFQESSGAQSITKVEDQIALSQRRFIQLFNEEVGLTPKLYCRIRRFQQVLQEVQRGRSLEWLDIAHSCGYYDQAHFIRDFKAFSGLNPSRYLLHRSEHLNHVPLPQD